MRTLASRHANLLMLKDTSGADRVADAGGAGIDELFTGARRRSGYSRHLKLAGGRYDGFLLSTANVFGPSSPCSSNTCATDGAPKPMRSRRASKRW